MQVSFTSRAPNSHVADIRQGAASIFDTGVTVGREAGNAIEVLVRTNGGSVEGTVRSSDRNPLPRATVVLVPAARRRQNSALYKIVQSDAQGHYVMTGVPPGSWRVFAWESVQPGSYQNSEFMQKYEAQGTSVTVNAGTSSTANVILIRD